MAGEITPQLQAFYQTIQDACLPGIWSKGVSLARDSQVQLDSLTAEEIILRVKQADRAVSAKVSLWPGDEDSFCDCGGRVEPCEHVAASVVALKKGLRVEDVGNASARKESSGGAGIRYQFVRRGKSLWFQRWLGDVELKEPLVRLIGGIDSGRIPGPRIAATQDDFAVDHALGITDRSSTSGAVDRATLARLFTALRSISGLRLDDVPVQTGAPLRGIFAEVRDDNGGFRLEGKEDRSITEVFENGAVLAAGQLRVLEDPGLSSEERRALAAPGRWFAPSELRALVTELLPALERKIPVKILARKLPQATVEPPRIVLRLDSPATVASSGEAVLGVTPVLTYGSDFAVPDSEAERKLLRDLQNELHLGVGQRVEFRGDAAVDFSRRLANWETSGEGARRFALESGLVAELRAEGADAGGGIHGADSGDGAGFDLLFRTPSGKQADPAVLFRAWETDAAYVPLLGGGFAPLPHDWLARYGARLRKLFSARAENEGRLPSFLKPELADLAADLGAQTSAALRSLKARLDDFTTIPDAPLPADLRAELRHYQRQGVNWLSFLRDAGLGALLADDMGLGKTLQALCAIRGRTLIVMPTSVLQSWAGQIAQFRPDLRVALYYGPGRKLDPRADVTLTTYGLLRQALKGAGETGAGTPGRAGVGENTSPDPNLLAEQWATVILDEAQTIKNADSQVALAAHRLRADFRVTLSGTPVENRMDDLWSQFRFLNPGLLGTLAEFREEYATPIARGEGEAVRRLRARIKPFILRRLKRDVAPELPPRTEVVLQSELSETERELYDSLLAAGRREVLAKLDAGGSVFGALELLLRLRQACCHPALVPGAQAETSSKVELLAQTLENSVAQGHRALIFSQWTSFLDLIEPRLQQMGLGFSRLDGGTADRAKVVADFQRPDGPPVMLISLKAGGVGITLTAADHVFLMDSWWNPAVEDQAADRVHRIGQENPVLVCRLITRGTVEERILELQKRKLAVAGAVLDGGAAAAGLTRDDIMALLDE